MSLPNNDLNRDSAADDQILRALLAEYGEPAFVAPPPGLAARVLARLPEGRPAAAPSRGHWPRLGAGAAVMLALALLVLGGWGITGDSAGPAGLLGGVATAPGRLLLILTLAAKPLVNLLLAPGPLPAILFVAIVILLAWIWRSIWHATPISPPLELRV